MPKISAETKSTRGHPFGSITREEFQADTELLKLWYRDPVRVDFGECIFAPIIYWIPTSITPNTITYCNTCINVVLLCCALNIQIAETQYDRAVLCVFCGILNFITMAMDALDGMHARATSQCSTFGELLDHWTDSLHVAISAAAIAVAFNTLTWVTSIGTSSGIFIYFLQLCILYFEKRFPHPPAVEAQCSVSVAYFALSVLYAFGYGSAVTISGSIIGMIVEFGILFAFARNFWHSFLTNGAMALQIITAVVSFGCVGLLAAFNVICISEAVLLNVAMSNRFNGTLVLYAIVSEPLTIIDPMFIFGSIPIAIEHYYLMDNAIRTVILSNVATYIPFVTPQMMCNTHCSVWLMLVFAFYKSFSDLNRLVHKVVKKDAANKKE